MFNIRYDRISVRMEHRSVIHDELAIDHDAILQCAEEVLHHCVIQTVSFVRHILCYSMGL
ncbi:hypothetical protein ABL499_004834 [Escherichia coli]|nr:hypothetical protein [Escherichia coli]EGJ9764978.1 hypothetical protein [Escherichia coli]EGM7724750.1 hypothetical protein [Escherichia coli]EHX1971875.1 hypothetical protein [Escherichia coli]EIS2603661.1 hypothetical protein [Escherichia coli]EIX5798084.1 hypothetical protein [Escherichia coli]